MKAVAIIVAGGFGKRMENDVSKQYMLLGGMPVLSRTLRIFETASNIGRIVLVVPKDDIDYARTSIVEKYGISKVRHIVAGGRQRQDSVKNGLDVVSDEYEIVLIHDGVRPFVSKELINLSVRKAFEEDAVTLGVPVKDTVKSVDGDGLITKTFKRNTLWLIQTPQVFKSEIVKKAYQKACEDNFYGTDDASLVEHINVSVKMIAGSYNNIKITTPEDLEFGEFLLKAREESGTKVTKYRGTKFSKSAKPQGLSNEQ